MSLASAPPLGVYVHWPYCARICPYCDFNVVRDRGRLSEQAALTDALVDDLSAQASLMGPRRLVSIFFGGGTPSLMAPESVGRVLETARRLWPAFDDVEVTLEANPTDAETRRFSDLADSGINRLSLGLQSLDDDALRLLGRNHDAATGRSAAAQAGRVFARVSVDLIYALPGQTTADWGAALRQAVDLGVEHISPYQLTIEPGTAFHRAVSRGALSPPAPDLAADLFETAQTVLGGAGFDAYEISNHARSPAARAAHNLVCWRGQDYLGIGPGAHGRQTLHDGRYATSGPRAITDYVATVARHGHGATRVKMSPREVALERLFMGLRTWEGVAVEDVAPLAITAERLTDLANLIVVSRGRLVVTDRGRLVLDRIIAMLANGA